MKVLKDFKLEYTVQWMAAHQVWVIYRNFGTGRDHLGMRATLDAVGEVIRKDILDRFNENAPVGA